MPEDKPIYVTQPALPPLDEFVASLEKSSYGFIRFKALNCSQDVVLKYRNGDAGNLGGKIPGLGFPQAKQALGFLEKYFDGPSH
jgi:hypothetical protein